MGATESQIADLITTTLRDMGRGKFEQIAQELQEYIVMGQILTKRGGLKEQEGGRGVERTLMVDKSSAGRWVDLYEKDEVNPGDYLTTMKIDWKHFTSNMPYERREVLYNKGEARVNKIMVPRRTAMMLDIADKMETAFFQTPSSDQKAMWGLKYWIVKNASEGFNGGLPDAEDSTIGGVNLTKYPKFKNYTNSYSNFTKADLVKKLRKAHRKTKWKSPVNKKQFRSEYGQKRKLLVNETTISAMEDIGEAANENLGRDLAPYDDEMVFKKHPIQWVPELDDDSSNPVYMTDISTIHPIALKGDNMRESEAMVAPNQHNVFVVYVDMTAQTICVNRRANAVLYQS